jgi:hypothetical protein
MNLVRAATSLSLLLLLAGSARADDAAKSRPRLPAGQCIDTTTSAINWVPIDDHTLLVRTVGRAFRITTAQCQSLAGPLPRITTVMRGGTSICDPTDAQLYVSSTGSGISLPCFMQSIEAITPDQARALEKSRR